MATGWSTDEKIVARPFYRCLVGITGHKFCCLIPRNLSTMVKGFGCYSKVAHNEWYEKCFKILERPCAALQEKLLCIESGGASLYFHSRSWPFLFLLGLQGPSNELIQKRFATSFAT